ncbi:sulfurtransferase [Alkalihalobacillus sp. MEB130]|uniref:sulfurtransferase n=1 Tax=Alkalihalobacillus sp. MEB130 TaxID=2976704 RepID=UPI0028DFB98A|nr:sulfurtransferase [Alkalihalobacillus sp. MEB130]MDT8862928.1 sulfurtransferase [Alkalihalobacillus sp. MEB130]
MNRVIMIFFVVAIIFAKGEISFAEQFEYPNDHLLVSTDWVEEQMKTGDLFIIDVRAEGFEDGHIPTAAHLHMGELEDKTHPIQGFLVSERTFEEVMNRLGVRNEHTIVVYDDGKETSAARLFYALEYYGHKDVRLLNGGYRAWRADQKDITKLKVAKPRGQFDSTVQEELMVHKDQVKLMIGKDGVILLDVRSPEEYNGTKVLAKRGGHIPTAVNVEWNQVLNETNVPLFKSYRDISSILQEAGVTKEKKIIVYCQKANRASHMYFTLRLMGYPNISVYEGSWEEWGNDPNTPISNPTVK